MDSLLTLSAVICALRCSVCRRRSIARKMIFSARNVGISFGIGFVRPVGSVTMLLAMGMGRNVSMKSVSCMG